jgi:hypothetical protein
MSKIKGQNFRLLMSGSAVPEETNVSVTVSGNSEDVSTKDTEGLFSQEDIITTAWSAQVDSYQAEPSQLRAILSTFIAASPVAVGWDQTGGSQNRVAQNANFKRSGQALLNDFNMQFDDRTTVNVSLQFQGTGALS